MSTGPRRRYRRGEWSILPTRSGTWMAWNSRDRRWVELVHGTFSEAVAVFEKEIGPYYRMARLKKGEPK